MPCLKIMTNLPKTKIPNDLAVRIIPTLVKSVRKPAEKFFCVVMGDVQISRSGDMTTPAAVATLESIGNLSPERNKIIIKDISDFISQELGISSERAFIRSPMSKFQNVASTFNGPDGYKGEKLIYPSATRNQEPILQVLKRFIICDFHELNNDSPVFLEISSGSGQHLAHFAPHFPGVIFQPSEVDENLFGSISYYAQNNPTKNILPPKLIDICTDLYHYGFEEQSIDYFYNANMMHIAPYNCTIGLFENAGKYLKPEALMITYGPYGQDGIITPASNVEFDASLKSRDPSWGLRDITDLVKLGEKNNLTLIDTVEMPSNNKTLIWKKD